MESAAASASRRGLARLWPIRSRAPVHFLLGERAETEALLRQFFGRRLRPWECASLAAAPDDATVELGTLGEQLYLETYSPGNYQGVFLLNRQADHLVLQNDGLRIHRRSLRRCGLGLQMFRRQCEAATALGVRRIETVAGRQDDENGYYTWPRFGFDAPLPPTVRQQLPPSLCRAQRVLDLMQSSAGRRWWQTHGISLTVTFDTAPQHRCQQVFRRYLHDRLQRGPRELPTALAPVAMPVDRLPRVRDQYR